MSGKKLRFVDLLILWVLLALADVVIVGIDDLAEAAWFVAGNTLVLGVYAGVLSART